MIIIHTFDDKLVISFDCEEEGGYEGSYNILACYNSFMAFILL
jgi:hypothetical protein